MIYIWPESFDKLHQVEVVVCKAYRNLPLCNAQDVNNDRTLFPNALAQGSEYEGFILAIYYVYVSVTLRNVN